MTRTATLLSIANELRWRIQREAKISALFWVQLGIAFCIVAGMLVDLTADPLAGTQRAAVSLFYLALTAWVVAATLAWRQHRVIPIVLWTAWGLLSVTPPVLTVLDQYGHL